MFISIGAIFLIMAFSTGGFGEALRSWLPVDQDVQNQTLSVIKTFRIHFYIILFLESWESLSVYLFGIKGIILV